MGYPLGNYVKASDELKEKMRLFKESVWGLPCMACGNLPPSWVGTHRAHHVVYKGHLPVEHQWDPRNAGPACDEPWGACHQRHHSAARRIPLEALSEANWEFAREVLGEAAEYYLERRYAKPASDMS